MAGSFQVNYNAGGVIDEVKKVKLVEGVDQVGNLANVEVVEDVKLVEKVQGVDDVVNVQTVQDVKIVDEIGKIRGFATKTQPFNTMKMFSIPAFEKDPATGLDYEFDIILPGIDVEIMAMSLTCSGYGEEDHYDLFVNGIKWFDNWYCSEVKEGLFIGTSTYVYAAPPNSNIKLVFKNDSGTSKTLWFGIRMLV